MERGGDAPQAPARARVLIPPGVAMTVQDMWFTNMLLLSFNVKECQDKYNISFGARMFAHPNKKGMEVALRFIMLRVDPKGTAAMLRNIWPVVDKKQGKEFKKVTIQKVKEWEQEGHLRVGFAKISHLQSAHGERLYQLLLAMSRYALTVVLEREHPHFPVPPTPSVRGQEHMAHTFAKATWVRSIQQAQAFVARTKQQAELQARWRECAASLDSMYRSAVLEQARALDELDFLVQQRKDAEVDSSIARKTREIIARLEEHHESSAPHRRIISHIASGNANAVVLDGATLLPELPAEMDGLTKGGNVDANRVAMKFGECVQRMAAVLEGATPTFPPAFSASIEADVASLLSLEGSSGHLLGKITKEIPEIERELAALRQRVGHKKDVAPVLSTPQRRPRGDAALHLIPPTPMLSFTPGPARSTPPPEARALHTPATHHRRRVDKSVQKRAHSSTMGARRILDLDDLQAVETDIPEHAAADRPSTRRVPRSASRPSFVAAPTAIAASTRPVRPTSRAMGGAGVQTAGAPRERARDPGVDQLTSELASAIVGDHTQRGAHKLKSSVLWEDSPPRRRTGIQLHELFADEVVPVSTSSPGIAQSPAAVHVPSETSQAPPRVEAPAQHERTPRKQPRAPSVVSPTPVPTVNEDVEATGQTLYASLNRQEPMTGGNGPLYSSMNRTLPSQSGAWSPVWASSHQNESFDLLGASNGAFQRMLVPPSPTGFEHHGMGNSREAPSLIGAWAGGERTNVSDWLAGSIRTDNADLAPPTP